MGEVVQGPWRKPVEQPVRTALAGGLWHEQTAAYRCPECSADCNALASAHRHLPAVCSSCLRQRRHVL